MRIRIFGWIALGLLAFGLVGTLAWAGVVGKLYVKNTEIQLTERTGQVCPSGANYFCERNYNCPAGKVAHAVIYNVKEVKGKKALAGLSLVCADPNMFSEPSFVGASGEGFAGESINDYCPVGYMLVGADFHTSDRVSLTGARRICRRYEPFEERIGPNLYGEGAESIKNVCPAEHWVTGVKLSYKREPDAAGKLDTTLLNARFFCGEIRRWLVEPSQEELQDLSR